MQNTEIRVKVISQKKTEDFEIRMQCVRCYKMQGAQLVGTTMAGRQR